MPGPQKCQQNLAPPSLNNIPQASLTGDDVLNVASVAQTCGLRAGTNEATVGEIRRFLTDGCRPTFSRLVPFFVDDIFEKANPRLKMKDSPKTQANCPFFHTFKRLQPVLFQFDTSFG